MKVALINDEVQVILEADGSYSPDVMSDLVNRAVDLYHRAFDDDDDDEDFE
jgi:hypothetical protein